MYQLHHWHLQIDQNVLNILNQKRYTKDLININHF